MLLFATDADADAAAPGGKETNAPDDSCSIGFQFTRH
jgi:hypothetical protein